MAINEHFVPKRKMTSTMQNGQIGFRNHILFKSLRSLLIALILIRIEISKKKSNSSNGSKTRKTVIMADFKDMLGIPRSAQTTMQTQALHIQKKESARRPKGMSREVWQIVRSQTNENGLQDLNQVNMNSNGTGITNNNAIDKLASVVPTHAGLKTKRKVSARKVSWSWQPFKNSARTDGLQLKHWVKKSLVQQRDEEMIEQSQLDTSGYGCDIGGDYAFAKYNKKVEVPEFTEREYEKLIANAAEEEQKDGSAVNFPHEWSKEETEYLFDILRRFDLRFIVAKDRWQFKSSPCERTIEDMKSRYYAVCRLLLRARASSQEEADANIICKHPFDPQHEIDRKQALETLLARTNQAHKEEAEILAQVKKIEADRRAETNALMQRQQAVFATNRFAAHEKRAKIEEIRKDFEADMPEHGVPCTTTHTSRDDVQPGVYPRSQRAVEVAAEIAGRDAPASGLGPRYAKRLDQSVEELGCPEPTNGTKAAIAGWLRLRKECGKYLALRKQIATAYEKLVHAGKVSEIGFNLPPATVSGVAVAAGAMPPTPSHADRLAGQQPDSAIIADRKPPGQKTGGLNIGFRDTEDSKIKKEAAPTKAELKRKTETQAGGRATKKRR